MEHLLPGTIVFIVITIIALRMIANGKKKQEKLEESIHKEYQSKTDGNMFV